jgi:hypothetical protein
MRLRALISTARFNTSATAVMIIDTALTPLNLVSRQHILLLAISTSTTEYQRYG